MASRIATPPRSRELSALSTNVPAIARLPSKVGAKRTPPLIGEPHDLDRKRQPPPAPVQVRDAGNRRDQSERAVPFAGVAHGVVMRAQHQARQAGAIAFITAPELSNA